MTAVEAVLHAVGWVLIPGAGAWVATRVAVRVTRPSKTRAAATAAAKGRQRP